MATISVRVPNGVTMEDNPVTPPDHNSIVESSQITLPSTEVPASPMDPSDSFKTENNDDRRHSVTVIPSSLTPPPSSQAPTHNRNGTLPSAILVSHHSNLYSPPATVGALDTRRGSGPVDDYTPPDPQQVLEASADELRAMLQTSIAEHARLKMETAHHKLQYNLLSLQADEDAKRAEVEHEMTRREVDALRTAEYSVQARREMSAATESAQLKYLHMKGVFEDVYAENQSLEHRLRAAKKLLADQRDEISYLLEDRDMLLNRISENREHFYKLCSPGGIFHGALTPKQHAVSTPQQQQRTAARQTPRSAGRAADPGQESMAALLQALSQDNNSAPTTPTSVTRPTQHRLASKHTRNTQSLSSLPVQSASRPVGRDGLLPAVDLVPQPVQDFTPNMKNFSLRSPLNRRQPSPKPATAAAAAAAPGASLKSRESTISAGDDNEELARQALQSVAKSASFLSQLSRGSQGPRRPLPNRDDDDDEEVSASQASRAASDMLRRDPRESFEVAASRDVTPGLIEKNARLQSRLLPDTAKNGGEKRKLSSGAPVPEGQGSPPKKMRTGAQTDASKVGLGIQFGQR
ncbi:hypothetical protein F5X68DRAFT_200563 [Plectosphaerella plurivora]|uniref:FAD-dependent oxidoreductase-like enzyme n=1 Tax=Plectosphaerella plurivora TaxID=936078 RepID=A0A9P9AD80_9PEZI|nr:hypothetical protein F5X68DRAFT_200563 [Plectosphaerella plurivora]